MTISGIHEYIRQQRLSDTQQDIPQYFQQQGVDVVVIDFCAEFFEILKESIAIPVFRNHLEGNMDMEIDVDNVNPHVNVFVGMVIVRLQRLYQLCGNIRIILVIDGERLFAKNETHKARNGRRKEAFNWVYKRGLDNLTDNQIRRYAYKWITFSQAIKEAIVNFLANYPASDIPVQLFDMEDPQNQPGIYYYTAQYEADPVVVHIATQIEGNTKAIISRDGDLFAYHEGHQSILRVTKFDWRNPDNNNFGQGAYTYKWRILESLGHQNMGGPNVDVGMKAAAEAEFAVIAATSGNDYAANVPRVGIRTIIRYMQLLRPMFQQGIDTIGMINAIIQKIAEERGWQALDGRVVSRFHIALYQFCRPQLPTAPAAQLLFNIPEDQQEAEHWAEAQRYTGGVPVVNHVQNPGSRYTSLRPDDGYFNMSRERTDPEIIPPPPPPHEPHHPKKKLRPFGSQNKEFPNYQSFKHPDNEGGRIGTYSYRSRKISYEGVVARETLTERDDATAIVQADMMTHIIRSIVRDMSYARYAALHVTNIALRLAHQYLDQQRRLEFYALYFTKNKSVLLWRDTLNCVTRYEVQMKDTDRVRWQATPFAAGVFNLLNQDGTLNQPKSFLKAYADDIYYEKLHDSIKDFGFARNVLMVARKIWYHQFGAMINMVPSSKYMGQLITESANTLDKSFRENIVRNFKSRYTSYLVQRLKQEAQVPHGWPNTEAFIDMLVVATNQQQEQDIQGPHITDDNRQVITDFVQRMRTKYAGDDSVFDHNTCQTELVKISTTPVQWPEDVDTLVKYLFYMIWDHQLYDGDESPDNDENQDLVNMMQLIQALPDDIQQAIEHFIQQEREEKNLYVGDLDILECLGLPPVEAEAEDNDNDRSTINVSDEAEDVQYDDDDAEIDIDDEYYGRTDKAKAGPLLGLSARMLEVCNGLIGFLLCPLQPAGTVFVPFNHIFFSKDFFAKGRLEYFAGPYIDTKRRELERLQGLLALEHGPQLQNQISTLQEEIAVLESSVQDLQKVSSVNLFDEVYDIGHRAVTIISPGSTKAVSISNRNYSRWLNKKIPDHDKRRFTARPYFLTDGVRISATYVDWLSSRRESMSPRYVKEIRRTTREDLDRLHHPQQVEPDLSNDFQGVVGLDFGQVCAVASVYRPTDPTLSGSQLIIKRKYLYGHTKSFGLWMEKRKRRAANDIYAIEQALSTGSTTGSLQAYITYLQALKHNAGGLHLFEFYSHPSFKRRKWDNTMSQRSTLDKACSLIINQASNERGSHADARPLLFAFGMDGMSSKSRRGQPNPMDHKMSKALYQKVRQLNRSRNRRLRHALTRVDEYFTSKTCCRCVKSRLQIPWNEIPAYMGRLPRSLDARSRVGGDGLFRTSRVVECATCQRRFHRDGNAADNMATIARYYLSYHRRPLRFIRPSRRIIVQ